MARDVRQYGDVQIDYWLSQPGISPELKAELLAEKARRAAPNVQSNLDAAATPITPEPVAGPARPKTPAEPTKWEDMTDEEINANIYDFQGNPLPGVDTADPSELEAYGQKYIEANRRIYNQRVADRQQARKAGYEDPEQLAYNEATGVLPEDYVAAGRPMPSAYVPAPPLPAEPVSEDDPDYWEKRYQQEVVGPPRAEPSDSVGRVDAYFADKAKRSESGHLLPQYQKPTFDEFVADQSQQQIRERARQEQETYGSSYATATDAQRAERAKREQAEDDMRKTRLDGIINRLASQTGTPRAEIRARLAGLQEPDFEGNKAIDLDDGLSPQEVAMLGQPFTDDARDRADAELADRRAFLRRRGMLAGSNQRANAANNWTDMPADWQNFVRAGGKGATPLDRDAVGARNAMRFVNAEALAGMDPARREAMMAQLGMQMAQGEEELSPEAAAARERARGGGTLAVTSSAAKRLLQQIEAEVIGPWATSAEVDAAVQRAVAAGIPQPDAEAHFARRRSLSNWWAGGASVSAAPATPTAGAM
jgi:hypothetical protein